jgi:nucleoid-associated protein YgaU/DNA-binding SARP family transcriptional activator
LLFGVPAALVALWSALSVDLSVLTPASLVRPDDGRLLILGLFAVGWVAWAACAGSIVAEIAASVRGLPVPHVRVLGPAQRLAATLVAAASVLLTPLAVAPPVAAGAAPIVATAPASTGTDAPAAAATPAAVPSATSVQPTRSDRDPLPTVVVQRHDTLWSLAERHLGAGTRYTEILELNRGVTQPDGRRLEQAAWLYPGWTLALPYDARAVQPPPATDVTDDIHVVEPGDTLWDIAEEELGEPTRYPEIFEANVGDPQPGGGALTDPDLIQPGWHLDMPATPPETQPAPSPAPAVAPPASEGPGPASAQTTPDRAPADVRESEEPTTGQSSSGAADVEIAVALDPEDVPDPGPSRGLVAVGLSGLALAGFVVELARRRRYQQRTRPSGARLPMPGPEAMAVEQAARTFADLATAERVLDSLRALAASARAAGRPIPDVVLLRVAGDSVLLTLRDDEEPLSPFAAWASKEWRLDLGQFVTDASDEVDPYPALLTLGSDGDDVILLNLESIGSLAVAGLNEDVLPVLTAMAADLTLAPSPATVLLGGLLPELAAVLDPGRVTVVHDPDRAEAYAAAHARSVHERLDIAASSELRRVRLSEDDELVTGCLIFVSTAPANQQPQPWAGVVGISLGANCAGGEVLRVGHDGSALLEPLGIQVTPATLRPGVLDGISESLHTADLPAVLAPELASGSPPDKVSISAPSGPRVLLLGRVEVVDVAGECVEQRIARLTELAAYLALHPLATRDEIGEAIWGGRRVEPTTRRQLISRTRTWLGTDKDGEPFLQTSGEGARLRLGDGVTCDWHEFQHLAMRGLQTANGTGLEDLDNALDLVRGRPFLGIDPQRYIWAEPHIQEMVTLIVDVARAAARGHLDQDEARLARSQAMRGLDVDPLDECLFHLATEACLHLNDTEAAARLATRFQHDVDLALGDADLAPKTEQLLQRHALAKSPV